jgi:MerR family transcriptional regulator, copper efflux regulator
MEGLTIGGLAKQAGVNTETIRYYERQDLLPKRAPSLSGHRSFPPEAVERIGFIKQAQELGFSLKEIKELLDLRSAPGSTGSDVRQKVESKISEVRGKIKALQNLNKELAQLKEACDGASTIDDCPILKILNS